LVKDSYGLQPSFFTSWADTQVGAGKPDYDDFKFSDLVVYDGFVDNSPKGQTSIIS
jgi:hypothetical protein